MCMGCSVAEAVEIRITVRQCSGSKKRADALLGRENVPQTGKKSNDTAIYPSSGYVCIQYEQSNEEEYDDNGDFHPDNCSTQCRAADVLL